MYNTDGTTFINGLGLGLTLLMCLLMLVLPRRHALLPVIVLVFYMTMGQRLMIAGLNFTMIRVLLVFGALRVIMRGEVKLGTLTPVDRALIWFVLSAIVTYTLLWKTSEAFVNRLGMAYDALGLFFLFRMLVRDLDDMRHVLRMLAWAVIPLAMAALLEKHTGVNPFGMFGGVPPLTLVRDGVLRCQGPFSHPILAGAFAAALIPLFVGLGAQRQGDRLLVTAAIVSALVVVVCAGSSGPVMAAGVGILGWYLFPIKDHMRWVRRGIVATLVVLHLTMQAPVWFILARMSIFDGSTGWHRSILIDHAIHHFPDWWLIGEYSTASWGYYMFDVTNQYILIGVQGGLITLVMFVTLISRCFASVGVAQRAWGDDQPLAQRLAWSFGCSLVVHATDYISVPYFDQNIVVWYLLLSMMSTIRTLPREQVAGSPVATGADRARPQAPGALPAPARARGASPGGRALVPHPRGALAPARAVAPGWVRHRGHRPAIPDEGRTPPEGTPA